MGGRIDPIELRKGMSRSMANLVNMLNEPAVDDDDKLREAVSDIDVKIREAVANRHLMTPEFQETFLAGIHEINELKKKGPPLNENVLTVIAGLFHHEPIIRDWKYGDKVEKSEESGEVKD